MIDNSISFLSFAFSRMSSSAFLGDIKRECPRGSWPNLIHPGKEKKQSWKEREGRRIAAWWWCSGSAWLCNILCRIFPESLPNFVLWCLLHMVMKLGNMFWLNRFWVIFRESKIRNMFKSVMKTCYFCCRQHSDPVHPIYPVYVNVSLKFCNVPKDYSF